MASITRAWLVRAAGLSGKVFTSSAGALMGTDLFNIKMDNRIKSKFANLTTAQIDI
jgi:hypothetical protein